MRALALVYWPIDVSKFGLFAELIMFVLNLNFVIL